MVDFPVLYRAEMGLRRQCRRGAARVRGCARARLVVVSAGTRPDPGPERGSAARQRSGHGGEVSGLVTRARAQGGEAGGDQAGEIERRHRPRAIHRQAGDRAGSAADQLGRPASNLESSKRAAACRGRNCRRRSGGKSASSGMLALEARRRASSIVSSLVPVPRGPDDGPSRARHPGTLPIAAAWITEASLAEEVDAATFLPPAALANRRPPTRLSTPRAGSAPPAYPTHAPRAHSSFQSCPRSIPSPSPPTHNQQQ